MPGWLDGDSTSATLRPVFCPLRTRRGVQERGWWAPLVVVGTVATQGLLASFLAEQRVGAGGHLNC